ncbi:hypothetical protein F0P96_10380 [Hymenobacter busanensis]|uniref:Uncharacterized protein n=1 Tax=Hymenobacter busanensis TaxID=2607656 RepID=A0A7L4ZWT5_9BACT|nr:hypothetical protein [Hymenobacter busanensis]KAA9333367.1 hypothetical protein F0P96_10380 [Hymenobacter busanensis]QHJ07954.1 hypothetical protein GUY19_11930 [Hymenobacter busanensis]
MSDQTAAPITHRMKLLLAERAGEALGLPGDFKPAEVRAFLAIDRSAAIQEEQLRAAGWPLPTDGLLLDDLPF